MNRFSLLFITVLFIANCESAPISTDLDEEIESIEKNSQQESVCESNTIDGECALILSDIKYSLPDKSCQNNYVIRIDTDFIAPADLKEGSTARLDWSFYPNGNAGFWITPLDNPDSLNTGIIRLHGCFSYGTQDTLKVSRIITDHEGVQSNSLTINIPKPLSKKTGTTSGKNGFSIISEAATLSVY